MRVFLCLFVFVIFSCSDSEPADSNGICDPIQVNESKFNSQQSPRVDLLEFELKENCLEVKLGVSGCDDNHTIDMVTDGFLAESLPPQITFDFYDNNLQDCEAYFTIDRSYDLTPIQEIYDGEIIIRFLNNDKFFNYLQ